MGPCVMLLLHILFVLLASLLLLDDIIVVQAASSNTALTFHITRHAWNRIRAGGENEENNTIVSDNNDSSGDPADDLAEATAIVDESSPDITASKGETATPSFAEKKEPNPRWSPKRATPSPFRLLHDIREEVASLTHTIPETFQNNDDGEGRNDESDSLDNNDPDEEETLSESNTNSRVALVGGAVAVAQQTTQKSRNNRLVGAPDAIGVDTSRVAPLSLRLLEENNAASDSSDVEEEKREDDPADYELGVPQEKEEPEENFAKLWWVNLWTQQLSDINTVDVPQKEVDVDSGDESSSSETIVDEEDEDEEVTEEDVVELVPIPAEEQLDDTKVDIEVEDTLGLASPAEPDPVNGGNRDAFVSSGLWVPIDNLLTLGLASSLPSLRISRRLRTVRKLSARVTGLHGIMSGKPSRDSKPSAATEYGSGKGAHLGELQKRIASIERVRKGTEAKDEDEIEEPRQRRRLFGLGRRQRTAEDLQESEDDRLAAERRRNEEEMQERKRQEEEAKEKELRMARVKEIDRLIAEGQTRLQHLICEKDVLQRRPNPLFNYTTETVSRTTGEGEEPESGIQIEASRKFTFPPEDLVEEYLDMTFSSRRLAKMNHTYLWQDTEMEDEDDDAIGDDLLTPSADAHKLYQDIESRDKTSSAAKAAKVRNGGGGSWLLRQTLGKGPSIGEKIGEVAETAAYKAVCAAVMAFLARLLSSLHGVNVMKHSDIRLVLEQAPDLPRIGEGIIPGSSSDYAQETIKTVMRRKARKGKRRSKYHGIEDSFVQRDAVTEMLLSHVQISAPLLKLFPIAWQRAFLGNIITLSTAIIADFFEGLQFQILGHSLTFSFAPITQEDMMNHFGLSGVGFNHRRAKADEFEAAVRATAEDVGEQLKFLDRWHERALGSGVLRTQIANLIARIVLTLTDEVLSGARMDLWAAQAGGPRLLAGLEYRTTEI